jgi:UDP-2,3-diacylglucosamine hydrolase
LRRLFVSDLHLAAPESPQFQTFAAILERHCDTLDALYLLGDLCEVWVGDDDDGTLALIDDPHLLPGGILLAHGDAFCTDDAPYQETRALVRSAAWQNAVLARSLTDRRALASNLREQSAAINANKPENIMDVNADAVTRAMARYGANTLIHGHTHRPGIHRTDSGTRYVLGAWEHCAWLLWEQDRRFTLECRPLTVG